MWEWAILILTLIILFGLAWAYWGAPKLSKEPQTTLANFLKEANNGDLIFLAGDTRGERACRWASGSVFSHVGLLFRENHPKTGENILYVWEADVGQGSRTGPRVMKVEDKLQRYKGFSTLGWRSLNSPRPSTQKILNLVKKHTNKTLDFQMWSWIWEKLGLSVLNQWTKDPKKVFCSELVSLSLQKLGMMKPGVPWSYSPQDFVSDPPKLEVTYSKMKLVLFRE